MQPYQTPLTPGPFLMASQAVAALMLVSSPVGYCYQAPVSPLQLPSAKGPTASICGCGVLLGFAGSIVCYDLLLAPAIPVVYLLVVCSLGLA